MATHQAGNKKLTKQGRSKAVIDWHVVCSLLEAHCSAASIADRLGIDRTTLYRRCEEEFNITFATLAQQKREKGDDDLRAKQHQVALSGDKVMLVWLGKNRLGQSDKQEITKVEPKWRDAVRILLADPDSKAKTVKQALEELRKWPFAGLPTETELDDKVLDATELV